MKPETFSSLIPFAGFYYSPHSDQIEHEEEMLFTCSQGEHKQHLADYFFEDVNYNGVYDLYTKEYVKLLAEELGIKLEWEEMVRPTYYNFQTDRLFARISRSDLAKIFRKVRGDRLNRKVREMFTSRDGFISHYSNNVRDWGRIAEWDHNQVGAVLAAYVDSDTELSVRDRIAESDTVPSALYAWAGPLGLAALWVMEKRYA